MAGAAFIENPTPANERRLAVLANPVLTAKRYGVLADAFADLRPNIAAEAALIAGPHVERIQRAFQAECDRRFAAAEPVMSNKAGIPR